MAMNEPILEELFDSPVKVRLLKLFLRNPETSFVLFDIVSRTKLRALALRPQLERLRRAGVIRVYKRKRKQKQKSKNNSKENIYYLNKQFVFIEELAGLVLKSSPASKTKMLRRIKNLGKVKLSILAGIFINESASRIDFLLVGDNISQKRFNNFIRSLEAESGSEIKSVLISTEEFNYRFHMFDRFLRDILEHPHEKLINKLNI